MIAWRIEALSKSHHREEFCCGKASLDDFLRTLVNQYEKRKLGRTYVAIQDGNSRVDGYYTLASSAIPFAQLPPQVAKKLPKHPVPVSLLGRLAVDQSVQGRGLGAILLIDALRRCLDLSSRLGIFAVEVTAIDDNARKFYVKHGFLPLLDDPRHLYLPMRTIEAELAER